MPSHRFVAALAAALACGPALAAPCAGFADVQDTDLACPAVEWLKNRGITQGCAAGLYCPLDAVSRAQMALFMNRLGLALSPQLAFSEASLAAVDPDTGPVLCASGPIAATAYPRQVLVAASFGGLAAGDLGYAVRPVASSDGGATWAPLGAVAIRDTGSSGAWSSATAAGIAALAAAAPPMRYAMRLTRESGSADFLQARCQVAVSVMNANGTASPFDLARAP